MNKLLKFTETITCQITIEVPEDATEVDIVTWWSETDLSKYVSPEPGSEFIEFVQLSPDDKPLINLVWGENRCLEEIKRQDTT